MQGYSNLGTTSYMQTTLPAELILLVIEFASAPKHAGPFKPLDAASGFPCAPAKTDFEALRGLSHSCRQFYRAVRMQWFRTLYIRAVVDWSFAAQLGVCAYVQEIRALSASLTTSTPKKIFLSFQNLHTAFIDAHNDFVPNQVLHTVASRDGGAQPQRGSYYHVMSSLPSSLRRLWIVNVHGPDAAVIDTVRKHCPQLEELSISRCTLFSPRLRNQNHGDPGNPCEFWSLFPDDHDSYFSNEGVESYAKSLSQELEPLSKLKKLHMGLYLTPHEAIDDHRRNHIKSSAVTNPWTNGGCEECDLTYRGATVTAETAANEIMFARISSLEEVSWASFFTPDRMGETLYIKPDTITGASVEEPGSAGPCCL